MHIAHSIVQYTYVNLNDSNINMCIASLQLYTHTHCAYKKPSPVHNGGDDDGRLMYTIFLKIFYSIKENVAHATTRMHTHAHARATRTHAHSTALGIVLPKFVDVTALCSTWGHVQRNAFSLNCSGVGGRGRPMGAMAGFLRTP